MIDKIHEKLQSELSKGVTTEVQALYILALVRKALEAENLLPDKDFEYLKFVCDWALHYRKDRVALVEEGLNGMIQGRADKLFNISEPFYSQLIKFLSERGFTYNLGTDFIFIVQNVCAYSPLIVSSPDRPKKVKITLLETKKLPNTSNSHEWSIRIEDVA